MAKPVNSYSVGRVRIRKRPQSCYWLAVYKDEMGKWIERSLEVTNRDTALGKAREIADLLDQGDFASITARRTKRTFGEMLEEFHKTYNNWSPSTVKGNQYLLGKLNAEWGDLPLQAVTTHRIEGYLARRIDQDGITIATRNRYLAALKTIFKCAMRWGYIGVDPTQRIKIAKEQAKIPNALSVEAVEAILAYLPQVSEKAAIVATIAADTGMRRSEIQRLTWGNVDLDQGILRIQHRTKSKDARIIPLPSA